jgi:hypothetical protein
MGSMQMTSRRALLFIILISLFAAAVAAQKTSKTPSLNSELKSELLKMADEDQKYRTVMETEMIKMSKDGSSRPSDEFIAAVRKQDEIDNRNIIRLEQIILNHGWPGKSLVGDEAANAAFLILQHTNAARQEKYLPLLKKAARKGEARPADAAMLEDRVLIGQGKKQIYGTQVHSGADTGGKLILSPVKDEKNVDKRRAAVGLMPLAEYLKHFGIDYKTAAGKSMRPNKSK